MCNPTLLVAHTEGNDGAEKPAIRLVVYNHTDASIQPPRLLILCTVQMTIVVGFPLSQLQLLLIVRQNAFQLVLGTLPCSLLSALLLHSQQQRR